MERQDTVLVVDDDRIIAENVSTVLAQEGYVVTAVNDATSAIEQVNRYFFNAVLLDLSLPDIGGIDLLRLCRDKSPDTCYIILTGCASLPSAIEALKANVYDYIIKPFDMEHLKLVIRRGIEKQRLAVRNKYLFDCLEKDKNKLEIIMEAYKRISGIMILDSLADFVTEKAVEIAEAEKASLMIVDESKRELVVKGSKGLDEDKITWKIKIGELIAGWVAQEGQALVVADIDTDPRFQDFANKKERDYKTKSFISLPLKAENRVIGVMNVTDKLLRTQIFTEEDLRYLSLLAHQTVSQIENILLCERLSSLVVTDSLTGLYNHRFFQEQLDTEILRSRRYKKDLSLAMLDVDSFKKYNDKFGHLEGDQVLKRMAQIMRQCIRKVDIVSRYGGEEFTIILPETGLEGAKTTAEKIRQAVEHLNLVNKETKESLNITISGGVAAYEEGLAKDEFIRRADQALHKAKSEGKNRICVF